MECEIPAFKNDADDIKKILSETKTIAVVGMSPKPERPSYGVSQYMRENGYKIIPVNPGHSEIMGLKCYKSLLDIEEKVDLVDVFRQREAVPDIAQEAIQIKAKFLWLQEGIIHNQAAEEAKKAGLLVVMNACLYKAHAAFS